MESWLLVLVWPPLPAPGSAMWSGVPDTDPACTPCRVDCTRPAAIATFCVSSAAMCQVSPSTLMKFVAGPDLELGCRQKAGPPFAAFGTTLACIPPSYMRARRWWSQTTSRHRIGHDFRLLAQSVFSVFLRPQFVLCPIRFSDSFPCQQCRPAATLPSHTIVAATFPLHSRRPLADAAVACRAFRRSD